MNQTEIFQNMTKGEWKAFQDDDTYGILKVDKGFGRIIICEGMRQGKTEGKADAELICLMKRETIDKGINPESVEDMKKILEMFVATIEKQGATQWNSDSTLFSYAKEALTAAKLT